MTSGRTLTSRFLVLLLPLSVIDCRHVAVVGAAACASSPWRTRGSTTRTTTSVACALLRQQQKKHGPGKASLPSRDFHHHVLQPAQVVVPPHDFAAASSSADGAGAVSHTSLTTAATTGRQAPQQHLTSLSQSSSYSSSSSSSSSSSPSSFVLANAPHQLVTWVQNHAVTVTTLTTLTFLAVYYRAAWLPLLNKDRIQATALDWLSALRPPAGSSQWLLIRALVTYGAAMAAWEALGLSTIPVETAAAMVFGWHAWWPSAIGKLMGASLAYAMGRTVLQGPAQARLLGKSTGSSSSNGGVWNQLLATDDDATPPAHRPLTTALFLKFSCFPEMVKNVGCGLVAAVRPWHFVAATIIHGWCFTTLWTAVGVDAAVKLQAGAAAAAAAGTNWVLRILMTLTLAIGLIGSPLLMAWWIRDLKRHAQEQHQKPRLQRTQPPLQSMS